MSPFPSLPAASTSSVNCVLSGYKVFPVEKLRGLIHLQPGQPANAVQADQDVEALKKLYGTRGYMAARIQATPEMNDADSTVKYVFQFEEGGIYKMGDLEIRGLDSKATERMGAAWKLHAGDTYDSGYPQQFVDAAPGPARRRRPVEDRRPRIGGGPRQDRGRFAPLRSQALSAGPG